MKKTLKIACFALLSVIGVVANAQTYTGKSATTTLNVTLANAYDIQIGQSSVTINMNAPNHFLSGNSSGNQIGHLVVNASTGYEVKVAATTELLNGAASIPVSTVTVKPELGAYGGAGTTPVVTDLTLTDNALAVGTQKTIISKDTGESKREYNVNYEIPAIQANEYLNKATGTYSTTITYSLFSK